MLAWLMTTAACPRPRSSLGSSSSPTTNRNRITPIWARTLSSATLCGGNTAADTPGATHPKRLGPSMIPASISPTTRGWRTRRASAPITRLSPRMAVNSANRISAGLMCMDNSPDNRGVGSARAGSAGGASADSPHRGLGA